MPYTADLVGQAAQQTFVLSNYTELALAGGRAGGAAELAAQPFPPNGSTMTNTRLGAERRPVEVPMAAHVCLKMRFHALVLRVWHLATRTNDHLKRPAVRKP
eukprot:366207-Chlamydomonas_euryale.AAC.5